jgi:acyl-CoA reductase-like NAD-dependent aldehyde dehydrogenase
VAGTIERATRPLSYASYIRGEDIAGAGWVYTLSSKSLLEDVFTSMRLKRALEEDPDLDSPAAGHPYVVGRCALVDRASIDAATEAAAGAVPEWSAVPLTDRMRLGQMFRDQLVRHHDELVDLLVAEAHPRKLARWELTCLFQVFSDASRAWYRQQMHTEFTHEGRRLIVRRQPDGVVCVNPPLNAPVPCAALAVLALMAGNAVVVRAPRSIALSTMYVMRDLVAPLLEELGAPPGTLNVFCGKPREVLDRWLDHPLVDDVLYFGGSQEGLRFERECVARGKKPILELAGNDGLMVWRDADLDQAAEAMTECFFGSGQICMVPNYVVVHPAVADSLLDRVCQQAARIRPGLPDDEEVLLSPVRRSEQFFALLEEAIASGAQLVCGGRRIELDGTPSDTGVFLEPTVLRVSGLSKARTLDVVRHETFFPLLPVIVPEDEDDEALLGSVLDFINANEYGLRNSVWARSQKVIDDCVVKVRNGGMLKINDSHIGFVPYLASHGGTGLTGGVFGEANYPILRTSHLQGVCIGAGTAPRIAAFDY